MNWFAWALLIFTFFMAADAQDRLTKLQSQIYVLGRR